MFYKKYGKSPIVMGHRESKTWKKKCSVRARAMSLNEGHCAGHTGSAQ